MASRLNLDEIQQLVNSQTNIVDPGAVSLIREGSVFEIDDQLVVFPDEVRRLWHDYRRVIVVQGYRFLGVTEPSTVIVVPCSASQVGGRCDFKIPNGENGFTKPNVTAYASLLMPVLKRVLTAEGHKGNLSDETYGRLKARIAANLGLEWAAVRR